MLLNELKVLRELDDTPFQRALGQLGRHFGQKGGDGRVTSKEDVDPAMLSLFQKIVTLTSRNETVSAQDLSKLIPAGRTSEAALKEIATSRGLLLDLQSDFITALTSREHAHNLGDKNKISQMFKKDDSQRDEILRQSDAKVRQAIEERQDKIVKLLMERSSGQTMNRKWADDINVHLALNGVKSSLGDGAESIAATQDGKDYAIASINKYIGLIRALEKELMNVESLLKNQAAPDASA
jgi:hypothetical protein